MTTEPQEMRDKRMRQRIIALAQLLGWFSEDLGLERDSDAALDWMNDCAWSLKHLVQGLNR